MITPTLGLRILKFPEHFQFVTNFSPDSVSPNMQIQYICEMPTNLSVEILNNKWPAPGLPNDTDWRLAYKLTKIEFRSRIGQP